MIRPPMIGIAHEHLKCQPASIVPGSITYAWPQWPFPDLKPLTWRQRLIRYLIPRKYWWLLR
jgi:hypothetical protein